MKLRKKVGRHKETTQSILCLRARCSWASSLTLFSDLRAQNQRLMQLFLIFFLNFIYYFFLFWGGGGCTYFWARGQIGATAAGLGHSHSKPIQSSVFDLSQQHQILIPRNEARDWTSILMDTSQVLTHWSHKGNVKAHAIGWLNAADSLDNFQILTFFCFIFFSLSLLKIEEIILAFLECLWCVRNFDKCCYTLIFCDSRNNSDLVKWRNLGSERKINLP